MKIYEFDMADKIRAPALRGMVARSRKPLEANRSLTRPHRDPWEDTPPVWAILSGSLGGSSTEQFLLTKVQVR
jgi:hypothetical protein